MNILVTGANGQLGNHIRLKSNESKDKYFFTDVAELDITDSEAVIDYVNRNAIEAVINCAAYTNVDRAEDDADTAKLINADAVGNLAAAMNSVGGLLVHVSTDYVFGGNTGNVPFSEDAETMPLGVYGVTKLKGEEFVKSSGCKYVIIRTAWLYSEYGNNFVKTMLNLTSTKESLNVVFDQIGTPTYAGDLADAIFDIVENRKFEGRNGVYHYTNEGVCSWYDFTKEIASIAGNTGCKISPCHTSEFPRKAARPSFSVLDKTKIKAVFGIEIPYWKDSVLRCINNLLLA